MLSRCVRAGLLLVAIWLGSAAPANALCVRGVEAWDTLRIRAAPGPQAREVGAIPPSACGVAITGACRGAWCPVVWRGRPGWSNAAYLSQGGFFDGFGLPSMRGLMAPFVAPSVGSRYMPGPPRPVAEVRRPAPKRVASALPPRPVEVTRARVREAGGSSLPLAPAPRQVERALPPAPPPVQAMRATVPAVPSPASPPVAQAQTAVVVVPAPAIASPPAAAAAPAAEMCVRNVDAGDTLKVRAGPGPDQSLRYGYPANACGIKLTGSCKDGWCPVDYLGYRGWAEQKFLK